jgi:hypothetical protein
MARISIVFLIIIAVVTLKVTANSAYYLTPDSQYYLQAAQNLLDGRGYRIDFQGKDTFCAIWPVGYSLLIATISFLTKLSVTISSKIVNLLAIAGILLLIHRQYKAQSWFVALALLSSSFLQLYANTWSETVFVFCLVGVVFQRQKSEIGNQKSKKKIDIDSNIHHTLHCFVKLKTQNSYLTAAFLTRYIGFFLIIPLLVQRKYKAAAVFVTVIGLYLLNNYAQTQTFTGDHGHWPTEPFIERLTRGLKGIGEEVAFWGVRDWDLKGGSEAMKVFIYGISIAQAGVLVVVGKLVISHGSWVVGRGSIFKKIISARADTSNSHLISPISHLISLSYLATTIVLYFIDDSIESLYFRRLAPATFLALVGGLGWLVEPAQKVLFEQLKWWIVTFFMLSVVHGLPKMYIFGL